MTPAERAVIVAAYKQRDASEGMTLVELDEALDALTAEQGMSDFDAAHKSGFDIGFDVGRAHGEHDWREDGARLATLLRELEPVVAPLLTAEQNARALAVLAAHDALSAETEA